jgi:peptide methionine sulfoxide reductase MsrA
VKQVGCDLGVRYVLEGSVRKAGGRVRITAQLIDTTTGAHIWADRFEGSLADIFDLQDNVASRIAGVIELALQAAETARSANRPIVTKIEPGRTFYPAEAYHQNYLTLHPSQPYIAINDLPKIEALQQLFPSLYRDTPRLVATAK